MLQHQATKSHFVFTAVPLFFVLLFATSLANSESFRSCPRLPSAWLNRRDSRFKNFVTKFCLQNLSPGFTYTVHILRCFILLLFRAQMVLPMSHLQTRSVGLIMAPVCEGTLPCCDTVVTLLYVTPPNYEREFTLSRRYSQQLQVAGLKSYYFLTKHNRQSTKQKIR